MQQSTIDHSSASSTREGEAPTSSRWGRPVPAARNEEKSASSSVNFAAKQYKTDQVEREKEETEGEGIKQLEVNLNKVKRKRKEKVQINY